MSLKDSCILVDLDIHRFTNRAVDRKATNLVASQMNVSTTSGTYIKRFMDHPLYNAVLTALANLEATHKSQTVPWGEGTRLLNGANYFTYVEKMAEQGATVKKALDALIEKLPELIEQDKQSLGPMFDARLYPTERQLRERFGWDIRYDPYPDGNDFRIALPQQEIDTLKKSLEARSGDLLKEAMLDTRKRVHEAVNKLRDRVDSYGAPGKRLYESVLTDVQELAESLTMLNISKDTQLDAIGKQLSKLVGQLSVEHLRESEQTRKLLTEDLTGVLDEIKQPEPVPEPEPALPPLPEPPVVVQQELTKEEARKLLQQSLAGIGGSV